MNESHTCYTDTQIHYIVKEKRRKNQSHCASLRVTDVVKKLPLTLKITLMDILNCRVEICIYL